MAGAYDVVVVGAGTGGYSAALRAAQLDRRVALIERDDRLGGTCLLRGCIPTKALLRSAEVVDTLNRAGEWGVKASGEADWSAVRAFQDRIVDKNVQGLTGLVRSRGVDVIHGTARLVAGPAVEVDGTRLEAEHIVLATGSRPRPLRGVGIGGRVLTSDEALELDRIPASVVVIGAGAVGCEFASMYRSFGADVTLLEALPRLAPLEDEDVSKALARAFRKRGITAVAGASVTAVRQTDELVEVDYEAGGEARTATAEICLVAIGREPVTDGLGLEEAGVRRTDAGTISVDERLRTTVERVWAIGDAASTPLQLAHVSFDEGYAVAERIAGLDVAPIDYALVPRVTYCTPELASVGLTEAQARQTGAAVEVSTVDLRAIGKANIVGEGGFVKVVAEAGGGRTLGVHMIGPHVTDLVAEAMLITAWEATAEDVARMHHPHPTLSEGVGEAFLKLAGKPLHVP
ncbi:MAG: dihydrolipoyl dehydrogenase [Actinomycetota bacterium]|jgi:dihydrolipoamide dehydrogenase|nr:MAG: dihydrolipoyl dehydrogenase [Actinomycetota bacterium]